MNARVQRYTLALILLASILPFQNCGAPTSKLNKDTNSSSSEADGDQTDPAVTIFKPVSGGNVSGTISVEASATDNTGISGVQFFVDGSPYGSGISSEPYSINLDTTNFANGQYSIVAQASDAAGNVGTSPITVIHINNVSTGSDTAAPAVSISAPAAASKVKGTVTISANATDNVHVAGVQFMIDNVNLGSEKTSAPFTISWDTTALANNSSHTIKAKARDDAGNTKVSAVITVTVDNTVVVNPNAKYSWIKANIVASKCASCHSSFNTYTGLKAKVTVNDPENSILYEAVAPATRFMPKVGTPLTDTQVKAIYDWIATGALNN
jgi:hypothetical protein